MTKKYNAPVVDIATGKKRKGVFVGVNIHDSGVSASGSQGCVGGVKRGEKYPPKEKFDPTKKTIKELKKLSRLYGVKCYAEYTGEPIKRRFFSVNKKGFIEFQASWYDFGKELAKSYLIKKLETKYKRIKKKRVIK